MTVYKLLNKNRNKNNIITSYTLIDQQGKRVDVNPIELKAAIKSKKVKVLGLTLTSDFRLVDGAAIKEKQSAAVKKVVPGPIMNEPEAEEKSKVVAFATYEDKKMYIYKDQKHNKIDYSPCYGFHNYGDDEQISKDIEKIKAKQKLVKKMFAAEISNFRPDFDLKYIYIGRSLNGLGNIMRRLKLSSIKDLLTEKTDTENITKLVRLIKRHRIKNADAIENALGLLGTLQFTGDLLDDPAYMTNTMIEAEKSSQKAFMDITDYREFTETLYSCCEWFYNIMLMFTMDQTKQSLDDNDINIILGMNKEIEKELSRKYNAEYLIKHINEEQYYSLICKIESVLKNKYDDANLERLYYTVRIGSVFPGDEPNKMIVRGFRGIERAYNEYFKDLTDRLSEIIIKNRYTEDDIGSGSVYMNIDMPIQRFFKTVTVEPFIM